MDNKEYFGQIPIFPTENPRLVSSSQWLNDPLFRDFFVHASLRRNHPDYLPTADDNTATEIIRSHLTRDYVRVQAMFDAEKAKNPAFAAWIARRHLTDLSDERLAACPPGSVGALLREFITRNGYKADLSEGDPSQDNEVRFFMRTIGVNHDLEHLLGGFGFDYIGEQGVTWMRMASYYRHLTPELASYMSMIYTFLIVPMFTRTLIHYPQTLWDVWDCISQGMLIGRNSDPIYMADYDSVMELPLDAAREQLGYRCVIDFDLRETSKIWSEGLTPPFDPRLDKV